jgi:hypothetical protein
MKKSDFIIDKAQISERYFGWKHKNDNIKIGLSYFSCSFYELSLYHSGYGSYCSFNDLLTIANKLAKFTIIKDLNLSNPFWKFYQINYNWEDHAKIAAPIIKDNYYLDLEASLIEYSTEDLKEIIKRRKRNENNL